MSTKERVYCTRCARPLVAPSSRTRGLCAGCVVEADNTVPAASGAVEHRPDCTGAAVVEHETARRRLLVCRTCGAYIALTRVTRWGDPR